MQRNVILTRDGSHTIMAPELNVTYHSIYGAMEESLHVFIEAGLNFLNRSIPQQLNIFEMGFGSGLNAILTAIEAEKRKIKIHYTTIEQFPLSIEVVKHLNYGKFLQHENLFQRIHEAEWGKDVMISEHFTIQKEKANLINHSANNHFELIYYHAFAPNAQREVWTKEVFDKMFSMLKPGGILVTYCSKGDVRRNMKAAGFKVEKIPGPPGKREMLRAKRDH